MKKVDFQYDYYQESTGFLLSSRLFDVLNKFNIASSVYKKILFTSGGELLDSPEFYLLVFNYCSFDKSATDFIDYDKTLLLPSRDSSVVTRYLVLKSNIEFDIFILGELALLGSSGIIVNENVKKAIEANGCGKGIKFLPIETAQEEYCKNSFKDFNDLIKPNKPRLP